MSNLKQFFSLAVAVLMFAGVVNAAEVYATTGQNGERVYSDKPAGDAQKITVRIAKPDESKPVVLSKQEKFDAMSPCEKARFIVRKYQDADSLAERNDDGSSRILSKDEVEAKMAEAREDEQRLCDGSSDE